MDDTDYFPQIEIYYANNERCDKIIKYLSSCENCISFNGEQTPHGYFRVRLEYNEESDVASKDLLKHYKTLVKILLENK